jgi:hypothetical protein
MKFFEPKKIENMSAEDKIKKSKLALYNSFQFDGISVKGIVLCKELILIPVIEFKDKVEAIYDDEFNNIFNESITPKLFENTFKNGIDYTFSTMHIKNKDIVQQTIIQINTSNYFGTSLLVNDLFYDNNCPSENGWLVIPAARSIFFVSPITKIDNIIIDSVFLKSTSETVLDGFKGKRISSEVYKVKNLLSWELISLK